MAYVGNLPPPHHIGFVRRPNLVLPNYVATEIHQFVGDDGVLRSNRRPRPLSIIAGAAVVLQSDQALLAR